MSGASESRPEPGDASRTPGAWPSDDDHPAAHGAALGAGGIAGWWAWKHRRSTQRGVDAVSPMTVRGTVHVALWFTGLALVIVIGASMTDWPLAAWLAIALVVMVAVGRWWEARDIGRRGSDPRRSGRDGGR